MSIKNAFVQMDIFRKMPKDLTEPTFCGAVVSFLCAMVLSGLVISEVGNYMDVKVRSDMQVDISHHDDKLNINLDIEFPFMPCTLLSLDVQDIMGTHMVDIQGSLFKKRIKDNELVAKSNALTQYNRMAIMEESQKALEDKEGCYIQGYFQINRVPGNFHISSHAFQDIVMNLEQKGFELDYTYKIN